MPITMARYYDPPVGNSITFTPILNSAACLLPMFRFHCCWSSPETSARLIMPLPSNSDILDGCGVPVEGCDPANFAPFLHRHSMIPSIKMQNKKMPASAEPIAIPATSAGDIDFVLVVPEGDEPADWVCVVMDTVVGTEFGLGIWVLVPIVAPIVALEAICAEELVFAGSC